MELAEYAPTVLPSKLQVHYLNWNKFSVNCWAGIDVQYLAHSGYAFIRYPVPLEPELDSGSTLKGKSPNSWKLLLRGNSASSLKKNTTDREYLVGRLIRSSEATDRRHLLIIHETIKMQKCMHHSSVRLIFAKLGTIHSRCYTYRIPSCDFSEHT